MNKIDYVWVCQQNIDRFNRLLAVAADGSARTSLNQLLDEEEAKLRAIVRNGSRLNGEVHQ